VAITPRRIFLRIDRPRAAHTLFNGVCAHAPNLQRERKYGHDHGSYRADPYIIGALNWGSIGLFQFDIVAWICGGQSSLLSRIIYTVVGLAGVWCISLLFRARETFDRIED
jgi:uncharacterized membrane protein YuzA (DUF378 family)